MRSRFRLSCLVAVFAAGLAVGCEDEKTPVEQCDDLVSRICMRMSTCGAVSSVSECRALLAGSLDCSRAVAVTSLYDTCMMDVEYVACAAFAGADWLPATCQGVILM